ncbi:uncharacterized protein LAESUDRAFT_689068 [Laetiporus sulphureus 93-53]|uniref:DUF7704 domain-containing protein n=1 Tax=Laetiporus sulphureus 93-53 TaxID=1314785 RepID=A0A165I2C6_9APHY|nr:uncharacterized protein LAESUDRAFT_689068 [Laetiporus sulphureus 93-53]KZT12501.1 hypothetical protein LAESUDRAFT_689068 [Laetiporus sulphureus 93-53]
MSTPSTALPTFYWLVFGVYEPLLTSLGFMGAVFDPKRTYDQQAPWPAGGPPDAMPLATRVTILQLGHVAGLLGLLNFFVLSACRKYLASQPALQEKIVGALLKPLLLGDFLHIGITLWALGDSRWDIASWGGVLWITIVTGFSLMIPRITWHLGIGRYVERRDGRPGKSV